MNSSSPAPAGRTYDLVLRHLTPDGAAVDATAEAKPRAAVPELEVFDVLNRIARIPPAQLIELEPQITIRGRQTNLLVRPDRGRLLVCELATSDRVWREMTPVELQGTLQGTPAVKTLADPAEAIAAPRPVRSRRWAVALLVVGLALNGYVLVEVFTARPELEFVPIGDGRPPKDLLETMTGSYTAIASTNHLLIELRPPNVVVFHDAQTNRTESDTYLFGSYKGRPRLITGRNGFIDLPDRRAIEFAGRRYERETARP